MTIANTFVQLTSGEKLAILRIRLLVIQTRRHVSVVGIACTMSPPDFRVFVAIVSRFFHVFAPCSKSLIIGLKRQTIFRLLVTAHP